MLDSNPFSQVLFIVEPQFGGMSDKHRQGSRTKIACGIAPISGTHAASIRQTPVKDLDFAERDRIVRVLAEERGNKRAAADRLGVSRRTLYRRLERFQQLPTSPRPVPSFYRFLRPPALFRLPALALPDFLAFAAERFAVERFAMRLADEAFRAVFFFPALFFALFLAPLTAFLAAVTCFCTRLTVRFTARRTARRGSSVFSIALVAALPAAVAAEVAAPAAAWPVSTTARVALPSALPTFSAAWVTTLSSSSRYESSAMTSPA
jgi:hypothetical protein